MIPPDDAEQQQQRLEVGQPKNFPQPGSPSQDPPEFRFAEQITPGGYRCDECASALQKTIRRGEERDALHFATELALAGYGGYVWKRLRIIASEDVGLGRAR